MAEMPNRKWYDDGNLDEMHADLRESYLRTLQDINRRPRLVAHFKACDVCQEIRSEKEPKLTFTTAVFSQENLRRRKQFLIDQPTMRNILGLGPNEVILFMEVIGEQQEVVAVTVASPDYPSVVPYNSQPPVMVVDLVREVPEAA
jgi:hypothetical protein